MYTGLDLDELVTFRKLLHQQAELSDEEIETSKLVKEYIQQFKPDQIWEGIGGHGLMVMFKGKTAGKNIGFRADLDALPISETIAVDYASKNEHVAHKCGHDGHIVMVAGLAAYLAKNPPQKGNIFLIFQPAEETGFGAERIEKFLSTEGIQIDYLFGLHNLPGFPIGEIVTKAGTFAAASKGMVIKLTGRTSHAAEPENGCSPVLAVSNILSRMTAIHTTEKFEDLILATVIHAQLGEIAFGTTPGYAEVRITLRAMRQADMKKLTGIAEAWVEEQAKNQNLTFDISYTETFPVTENEPMMFDVMQKVAEEAELTFKELDQPFKWSEDFGHYMNISKTGFFGLGAGLDAPNLHHEAYDFPDEIIEYGLGMYIGLIQKYTFND